ncbi:MAG TPA: YHS domain-containing protein [Bryobacteraceae bacterium]|nr:YHS domain-containing protein [Bryobacteraceae bacterium]
MGEGSTYGHFGLEDYGNNSPVRAVDPVCGKTVEQNRAAAKTEYAGQTHYFCSPECQRDFEMEPAVFIGGRR